MRAFVQTHLPNDGASYRCSWSFGGDRCRRETTIGIDIADVTTYNAAVDKYREQHPKTDLSHIMRALCPTHIRVAQDFINSQV